MDVFEELKRLMREAHVDYMAFMKGIGCYDVDPVDFESLYPDKATVDLKVIKARVEGRLLVDENHPLLHYWMTHSDCRVMALFIRLLFGARFKLPTRMVNVGRFPSFHAVVRFELDGQSYYVDGLQYSKNPDDLSYTAEGESIVPNIILEREEKSIPEDENNYALLMLWCRNFNIDLYRSLGDDWRRPEVLLSEDSVARRAKMVEIISSLEREVV